MISKPKKYEEIELKEYDFEPLELGGHRGVIKEAQEYTSEFSGKTSLKVFVDTSDDDKQPAYFTEQYKSDTRADKKWSNSAIKYVPLDEDDDNCVAMLKAFITSVENSNNGFKFDWNKDLKQLANKKVGLVYGLEEYENQNGEIKTTAKITRFRSIDKIDDVKIPKVKLIDGSYVEYDEYKSSSKQSSENKIEIKDDDLPF